DREILAQDGGALAFLLVSRNRKACDLHGLGAAGELPEQLVAAAHAGSGAGRPSRLEIVPELDAVYHAVPEARAPGNVELVAVAVARAQAMVTLTRLVEGVEIHDQVELVVQAG